MKNRHNDNIKKRDYKNQKIKYKSHISSSKQEDILFSQRTTKKSNNNIMNITPLIPIEFPFTEEKPNKDDILELIEKLDTKETTTFQEEFSIDFESELSYPKRFLYHGLRFQKDLEKLEGILKERKILAGKYLKNYYNYSDNCNEGNYVSLAHYSSCIEFETFIRQNICLIISPLCEAQKTIFVPYHIWNYIKEHNIPTKNRYSYSNIEYQVKDFIPIEMIRAIGIPYLNIIITKGIEYAEKYKQDIINLLNKYNITLPIVDINNYNEIIYSPSKSQIKKKTLHA